MYKIILLDHLSCKIPKTPKDLYFVVFFFLGGEGFTLKTKPTIFTFSAPMIFS